MGLLTGGSISVDDDVKQNVFDASGEGARSATASRLRRRFLRTCTALGLVCLPAAIPAQGLSNEEQAAARAIDARATEAIVLLERIVNIPPR
jgi:hypothetical protein